MVLELPFSPIGTFAAVSLRSTSELMMSSTPESQSRTVARQIMSRPTSFSNRCTMLAAHHFHRSTALQCICTGDSCSSGDCYPLSKRIMVYCSIIVVFSLAIHRLLAVGGRSRGRRGQHCVVFAQLQVRSSRFIVTWMLKARALVFYMY